MTVRKPGRPHAGFSKRGDAAHLLHVLERLGCSRRAGEAAIEALLGVGPGELHRGRAKQKLITAGNEESEVLNAVVILAKYRTIIRSRFEAADTGAQVVLEGLPESARGWLSDTLPELCTGH